MKITWIGHSCFFIEAREGRIVTDPFAEEVPYAFPELEADLVTVSHDHFDHNAVGRVGGNPIVLNEPGRHDVAGLSILGVPSFHDDAEGAKRGKNTMFVFTIDGIRTTHLGDLGTSLSEEQRAALGDVRLALIPVGGNYTIGAKQAAGVVRALPSLRVVIPMHFKTDRVSDWPIETVEPFAKMMDNVRRIGGSVVSVTLETLPEAMEVWVPDYAGRY